MRRFAGVFIAITLGALIGVVGIAFSQGQSELAKPNKIIHRLLGDNDDSKNKDAHPGNGKPQGGNGISYHGGPVMTGTTLVYYIWYGNWGGNSANTILKNFAQNIGGSPYFNINTTYYNGSNDHVTNCVNYGGSTTDNYSRGTSLTRCSRARDRHGCDQLRSSAERPERRLFRSYLCGRQ